MASTKKKKWTNPKLTKHAKASYIRSGGTFIPFEGPQYKSGS